MTAAPYWSLINEVLRTGPADGQQILARVESHNLWQILYLATKESPFATAWREAFGRQRLSQAGTQSVLGLAVGMLVDAADTMNPDQLPDEQRKSTFCLLSRFIANCCVESSHNRRVVVEAGALGPLMKSLGEGLEPNVLIPTIYNACADLEDAMPLMDAPASDQQLPINIAEARLARADISNASIYSGLNILLNPTVVESCSFDILDYLSDLIEMAARPVAIAQAGYLQPRDLDFSQPLELLLAAQSGKRIIQKSATCRNSIAQALLFVSTSPDAKAFLAASGKLLDVMMMISYNGPSDFASEDEEEHQQEESEWTAIKDKALRLCYEVAALPEYRQIPHYATVRFCLNLIHDYSTGDAFTRAVAYILLYHFIDGDLRAGFLVREGLLGPLVQRLGLADDRSELHPALALVEKLAITWQLKPTLYTCGILDSTRRFLLAANLGYEIPRQVVTIMELVVRGHPEHVVNVLRKRPETSILDNMFTLFEKGNEEINFEIGRFFVELIATMATPDADNSSSAEQGIQEFLSYCSHEKLAHILLFMAAHPQQGNLAASQRVYYALALLSMAQSGRPVAARVMQDPSLQEQVRDIESAAAPLADNIRFIKHHLEGVGSLVSDQSVNELANGVNRVALS